jgi:hypothetical protein
MLLNMALHAKKYNKNIQTKDPSKTPVILFVSQENTINETLLRIWSYLFGNDSKIHHYDHETAMNMLYNSGLLSSKPGEPEIIFKFRSNKSINTSDLDHMIDELELEGKEVVFLIQDYMKRIRSTVNHKELRLELGEVTNEFSVIAKERDIPVLSAMQLNREAFRIFEEASGNLEKQFDIIKRLGVSHVGESLDIIQNCDYAFIQSMTKTKKEIAPGMEPIEQVRLFVKLVAGRGQYTKIDNFIYNFAQNNGMKLEEDVGTDTCLGYTSIKDQIEDKTKPSGAVRQAPGSRHDRVITTRDL